ncbi:DUF6924 domain-containing protein [Nocardioides zeae]|uniref:DUF6924 domain-containing protein n=1 Tax=Nocardioides zeae TaxID=1457234 RepID=A0A6P0HE61_9ACTN|nr:hypothetical protein [Nocardioides zeae]NEN76684.1 hypothetical protein [Nocardioides zeae]
MSPSRVRDLAAPALLPAVALLLVLTGCGDVGGPGDTDPVRAGAETSLEVVVGEAEELTQAEIDEQLWGPEDGDPPPFAGSNLCGDAGAGGTDETEEIDMSLTPGTPLEQALADNRTTAVLVRTDRSDDAAWARLTELVLAGADFSDGEPGPCGEEPELYQPAILTSDDPAWQGVTAEAAIADLPPTHGYLLLADERSMREVAAGGEVTVLWVDLGPAADDETDLPRTFRSTVDAVAEIEANLAIANLGFFEYADGVDPDGVYRGF